MRPTRYHLPQGQNVHLIDPPVGELSGVVAENKQRLASAEFTVAGVPRREAAERARAEALSRALEYTRSLGVAPGGPPSAETVIATGHQPGMNHPGVWIKNHLVGRLARELGGCGVNIVLDTDVPGALDFQVPRVVGGEATVEHFRCVPALAGTAVEEQRIDDPGRIAQLHANVLPLLGSEPSRAAAAPYLEHLRAAARKGAPLGYALAYARRQVEESWGLTNLELPYSAACNLDSFRLLVLEILRRADEFASVYNARLAEYRRAYKVRGKANPLPDLALSGGTVELPLWIWRAGGERRALIIRRNGSTIEALLDGETIQTLSEQQLDDPAAGMDALRELAAAGIRIRSKALVTTIYMRLFLFDIFVHGIGGGNYDIIADEIIRDFFGVDPPVYAVATANATMPFEQKNASRDDLIRLREKASHMHYGPHNFAAGLLPEDPEVAALLDERWEVLRVQEKTTNKIEKKRLFARTKRLGVRLRERIAPFIAEQQKEVHEVEEALKYNAIVTGREYPFCIYPEDVLREVYSFRSR